MEFGGQIVIALGISCALFIPLYLFKYKKYKKEGKSIKYLELKIAIAVGLPIMSIPIILSGKLSPGMKLIMIIVASIAALVYFFSISYSRKAFRKIFGLPPEDEDTGEVIKDGNKKKNETK